MYTPLSPSDHRTPQTTGTQYTMKQIQKMLETYKVSITPPQNQTFFAFLTWRLSTLMSIHDEEIKFVNYLEQKLNSFEAMDSDEKRNNIKQDLREAIPTGLDFYCSSGNSWNNKLADSLDAIWTHFNLENMSGTKGITLGEIADRWRNPKKIEIELKTDFKDNSKPKP